MSCGREHAQHRKDERYTALAEQVRHAGWTLHDRTIEVGARGCIVGTFRRFLRSIGLSNADVRETVKNIAFTAARCSYAIFLAASNELWGT